MIGVKLNSMVWNKKTILPLLDVGLNVQIPLDISWIVEVTYVPEILEFFVALTEKWIKHIIPYYYKLIIKASKGNISWK